MTDSFAGTSGKPRIQIARTVEWCDTDAAGHYHHSTVIRWVEAAEAALHKLLRLPDLFGVIPRIRYEVTYAARVWFGDEVTIQLEVAQVGRTSVEYEFKVIADEREAAAGCLKAVLVDRDSGLSAPWPDEIKRSLMTGVPMGLTKELFP